MEREPGAVPAPPGVGTRELFRLAWPILVAQLAIIGLATIDAIMAGRLSANDLAGVALGGSVYASIFLGFMGVQQALTPIAGHHFGAGQYREIGADRAQALWLAVFMTLIGVPLLLWTDPWMRLASPPPAVEPIAVQYLAFVACGLPATLLSRTYVSINSAVSRPRITMMVNLGMLLLKAPLNLVFMYGAGPIPALGGAGCGLASAVLFWLACAAHTTIWHVDPFYTRFRLGHRIGPRWVRQKEMLRLGVPAGLTLLIEVSSFTAIAILLVRYGAQVIAGHQIVANLISLVYMLPLSIGAAASVLVAQSLGAGAPRLARNAALRSLRIAVLLRLRGRGDAVVAARAADRRVHGRPASRGPRQRSAGRCARVPPVRRRAGDRGLRAARLQDLVRPDGDPRRGAVGSRPRRRAVAGTRAAARMDLGAGLRFLDRGHRGSRHRGDRAGRLRHACLARTPRRERDALNALLAR